MKYLSLILILLTGCYVMQSQTFTQIDFQGSDENFANPERGFYHYVSNVNYDQLVSFREEEAITLIYKNFKLDDYTETEIPLWYLQNMKKEFAIMRKAGIKCVLRFNYTFKSSPPYGDARPEIVLKHVAQLKPYLQANSDVIYVLQAGFIGAWGEWYYTDYYKDWDDRRELMDALLDAMPADRQVQLRTPNYKQKIMEVDDYVPVSEEEAYTNIPIARISHHNDCFVASVNDFGTYQDTAVEKPYLADDSKYTLVGGETCAECTCASCENSLLELRRFHWSYINIDYHTAVLQGWKDEGCFPTVERKLGYRYRMLSASIQNESKSGGTFDLSLKIFNDGWANPGNPRDVEMILRNKDNNELYYLPLNDDPRFWPLGDTITITINAGIPTTITDGEYEAFLNLPDPEPNLANRSAFSIRTANTETWEGTTGYNSLQKTVSIKSEVSVPTYVGSNIFKPKNAIAPDDVNILIDGKADDWEKILPVYTDHQQPAKIFKSYNTIDSLFFVIEGNGLHSSSQLFIDADKNTSSGYAAWQWIDNGADYLIENDFFYKYSGSNHEWGWEEIGTISKSGNDTVIEVGIDFNKFTGIPLEQSFSIGLVNDPNGTVQTSYIPAQGSIFLPLEQVAIFGAPLGLDATTYSNNNVLFWANGNASTVVQNVLERSENGIDFEPIHYSNNNVVSYTDNGLEENKEYSYRIKYAQGNYYSNYQGPVNTTTSDSEKVFVFINLDGEADDWDLVGPSGTGFDNDIIPLRLMNYGDELFFSFSAEAVNSYKLYFDVDENNSFDYLVSNDSVFAKEGDDWLFTKKIESYTSTGFVEASLKIEDLEIETTDYFLISATVNGVAIPANSPSFLYTKAPVIPTTTFFIAEPSVNDYYTKSVVRWKSTENTQGYIIERSDGDTLNFKRVSDKVYPKTFFVDSDLDSSIRYYYRMFSYNDIYRSVYTQISNMKPGTGMGYNDHDISNAEVTVAPNPFSSSATIEVSVKQPEVLTVEVYDKMGRNIKTLFNGNVYEKKFIELRRDFLDSGLYFIKISGSSTNVSHKIIVR